MHQTAIATGDMFDIGGRGVATILRLLAVQSGEALNLFHGELALGIERCHLGAFLANLDGKLLRRAAVEISVNEPG